MRDDIVQEILLRLPVKSLARCKSLSKDWQEFISHNPSFRKQFVDRNRGCSFMLGFHITKCNLLFETDEKVQFLTTYNQGISMFNKRKRDNDGSVSFLLDEPPKKKNTSLMLQKSPSFFSDPAVRVLGSSNGFLLCSLDTKCPLNYVIINPINKLCASLPIAKASRSYYNHGFICRSTSPQLDTVDYYKVVRGISSADWRTGSPIVFEIFSSDSNRWSLFLVSGPFDLDSRHSLKIMISDTGIIYASGGLFNEDVFEVEPHHSVISFDEKKEESLQVMEFPPTENGWICQECIGQSESSILYARNELGQLKIWRMNDENQGGSRWSLIHTVSLENWFQQLELMDCPNVDNLLQFRPEAFHPTDQNVIFIVCEKKRLAYDMENSKLMSFSDTGGLHSLNSLFPYTCGLIGPHLFPCD